MKILMKSSCNNKAELTGLKIGKKKVAQNNLIKKEEESQELTREDQKTRNIPR